MPPGKLRSVSRELYILHNPELVDLGDLGGAFGSLRTIGGTYAVYCSPKLDPAAVEAVLVNVEGPVVKDILLDCD